MSIIIGDRCVELGFCNAMLHIHGIDIVLSFFHSFFSGKLFNESLHNVVVIQHVFHLAAGKHLFRAILACHNRTHNQGDERYDNFGLHF